MPRYIFITGGVVSSLGKGLASAALGALLQSRGYKVRLRKLDPYLNGQNLLEYNRQREARGLPRRDGAGHPACHERN